MKKITKNMPNWFNDWISDFVAANGRAPHYVGDFSTNDIQGGERRGRLRKHLAEEQGYICCYCMSRISESERDSHIEHFWPKKKSGPFYNKDMEYSNLFASCQGVYEDLAKDHCGHRKNDWWDFHMISPIDSRVEHLFVYTEDGKIHNLEGDTDSDIAAQMIHEFGLDSYHLQRKRCEAIEYSEVFDEVEYTKDEVRDFIDYYYTKQNGKYEPYCKAIIDCLKRLL